MPELPDIVVYVESLERRIVGLTLDQVRLKSPFVLRTAVPPLTDVIGKRILAVRRIGKRIALVMEGMDHRPPHPAVTEAVRRTAELCEQLGHVVEEVARPTEEHKSMRVVDLDQKIVGRELMGTLVNRQSTTVLAILCAGLILGLNAALVYQTFAGPLPGLEAVP